MVKNRIPELIKRLDKVSSERNLRQFVTGTGSAIGDRVLMHLRRNQPVGETEPSYQTRKGRTISHGRPSHRLFGAGSDIGSSWLDPEVTATGVGGEVVVVSTAPHIKYVIDGTEKHGYKIPTQPTGVSFFHLKSGRPIYANQITHPGTAGNPFVDKSIEDSRPQNLEDVRAHMREVWQPLRSFLS